MKITKKRMVNVVVGATCDACGFEVDEMFAKEMFEIEHSFGYNSACDCIAVSAIICDDCLLKIVLLNIPNAQFSGDPDVEKLKKRLEAKLNKDPNWTSMTIYKESTK